MLCSKCHENIPRGKEIQIEGSIICEECALVIEKINKEKIIARCWNCNRFIRKDELIHESSRNDSKNFSKWFSFGIGSSEKLFQCGECYQKWRNDMKKAKNLSRLRFLLLGICTSYSLNLVLTLFFPEVVKKANDNTFSIITLLVILFVVIVILGPILEINRYEIRERKVKK